MGAVNFSIDKNLVKQLKNALNLSIFVETGTFEGDTIESVRELFDKIFSVEISHDYYRRVKKRFFGVRHVELIHSESPSFLKQRARKLSSQAVLYWLDAHWCAAEETGGGDAQCPLLEELAAIGRLNESSVIMIDDARLFFCTPNKPHKVNQWPRFQEVLDLLRSLGPKHRVMVLNDVILLHPISISQLVDQYAYDHGVDWLHQINRARRADELERESREQQALLDFFMKRALDMPKDQRSLWDQLVEKEAVIQGLVKQLRAAQRQIDDLGG